MTEAWKKFRYAIDRFETSLKHFKYQGAFDAWEPTGIYEWNPLPPESVSLSNIEQILAESSISPPHGFDLLKNPRYPDFPVFPEWPNHPPSEYERWISDKAQKCKSQFAEFQEQINKKIQKDADMLDDLWMNCALNDEKAISQLLSLSLSRHPLPAALRGTTEFAIDLASRIVLATTVIPRLTPLKAKKKGYLNVWSPVSAAERKRAGESILYGLTIRTAYLIACSDAGDWFDTIAVNARQSWNDPATGVPREGIVASLQATKSEIRSLQVSRLDPKACFRHLKGISTPSVEQVAPIRPIFVMNKDDDRVVENKDVIERIDEDENLAVMPWEDFEQLVRQLFELEFGRNGIEVKVTRASRDRGVDAIMYDPDPFRGGKYVLQAKRYTRTVDVSSVRDLYGTVLNEGANRGILVTTATYGPDAYEFAKNKPISLIDGPNLIAMLKRHGRSFRIDLEEARRIAGDRA